VVEPADAPAVAKSIGVVHRERVRAALDCDEGRHGDRFLFPPLRERFLIVGSRVGRCEDHPLVGATGDAVREEGRRTRLGALNGRRMDDRALSGLVCDGFYVEGDAGRVNFVRVGVIGWLREEQGREVGTRVARGNLPGVA
jgi:hypothetical protein